MLRQTLLSYSNFFFNNERDQNHVDGFILRSMLFTIWKKIEVKSEHLTFEENLERIQVSEKEFSYKAQNQLINEEKNVEIKRKIVIKLFNSIK